MTVTGEAKAVEVSVHVKATPEVVYQYLTDPVKYVLWKGRKAKLEPKPGGTYWVEFNERDTVSGKFVEVVPNEKVVFTWGWETPGNPIKPGSSTVSITLVPDGAGTKLTLVHTGLPEPAMDHHRQGWVMYADRLAIASTGGNPGTDPNATPQAM